MTLWIQYSADVDFLTLWNGVQSGGGEDVAAGLTVFFDNTEASVVSFTVESAVRKLAPILYDEESDTGGTARTKVNQEGYLEDIPLLIEYRRASDTLRLTNGRELSGWRRVAESLTAEFDMEGEVIGLTLERAAAQLKPYLNKGQSAREWAISA